MRIRNEEELLQNVRSPLNSRVREIALDALECALRSVNPRELIKSRVALSKDILNVQGHVFDLKDFRRILVIGGGKASGAMAEALEEILGDQIEEGLVVVPHGMVGRYRARRIEFREGGHPIPDLDSVEGARKMMEIAEKAEEGDLILCLISGGGSSMIVLPRKGINLNDKQGVTEMLLKSGASIQEINKVRKHLSAFKGGWLAKRAYPAITISLLLSDVVGDPIDAIASGPTAPDPTTFMDAIRVLERYKLWQEAPESVRRVLSEGVEGLVPETPKVDDHAFERVYNIIIGNNRVACSALAEGLRRLGLKALFLTSFMEGEARDVGFMLGALAREVTTSGNPIQPSVALIIGGETTVTVTGSGIGGRNQEVALGAALKIDGLDNVAIATISTDGVDGPTDAAGAIVDGGTINRSRELGLDAEEYLKNNDSYTFFSRLGDLIYTGPTGTNVNDISVLIVL